MARETATQPRPGTHIRAAIPFGDTRDEKIPAAVVDVIEKADVVARMLPPSSLQPKDRSSRLHCRDFRRAPRSRFIVENSNAAA
ncbi:MAG: hypothetical protein WBW84_19625 [Acidobacteriaceae bacterium]